MGRRGAAALPSQLAGARVQAEAAPQRSLPHVVASLALLPLPADDAFYTTMNPAASLSLPYDYWRNATTLANMIKRHVIVTNKTNVGTMTSFKNATFADPGGNCTVRVSTLLASATALAR